MNEKNELIRLTLKKLETVGSAYKILEEKDNHFTGQVDKFMENKLEEIVPTFEKLCKFNDKDELKFWAEQWKLPDERGKAYFFINAIEDDDLLWITCFVGKLEGLVGIDFNIEEIIRGKTNRCSQLTKFYEQNEIKLKKANFLFNGEKIYHPIQLDLDLLAESYPDYIAGDVFQPLEDALNDIKSVHHIFGEFVKQLIGNTK